LNKPQADQAAPRVPEELAAMRAGDSGDGLGCAGFRSGQPTRREAIRAGALALTGLGMPELFRGRALAAPVAAGAGFGRAKSCLLIFMWGGPSQLDTWDLKPDAPREIRGEFAPIATRTPGLFISEHFPRLAKQTQRLAVVRSFTHDDPAHLSSAHRLLTGHLAPRPYSDAAPPSPQDWPHLGSIVAKVRPSKGALPASVTMPWTVMHPAAPGGRAPGQNAGWLGKSFDPLAIDGDPNAPGFKVGGLTLPEGMTNGRLDQRRGLLERLSSGSIDGKEAGSWSSYQSRAFDALCSADARGAFQLEKEDPKLRDAYGRNIHGQCLLLGRRLIEAGVPLVTVNWHNDGVNFWDTHDQNFKHLKDRLMPPADQGFSTLLDDLDARGLLDETLVVWVGEFGRNPKISPGNAGREHWPRCYSGALAGGGIRGGQIYGASDRFAAFPALNPVSPDDLGATILHALGIDPAHEVVDALGRPMRINNGLPVTALFG
jgi:hypothetical protein